MILIYIYFLDSFGFLSLFISIFFPGISFQEYVPHYMRLVRGKIRCLKSFRKRGSPLQRPPTLFQGMQKSSRIPKKSQRYSRIPMIKILINPREFLGVPMNPWEHSRIPRISRKSSGNHKKPQESPRMLKSPFQKVWKPRTEIMKCRTPRLTSKL